MEAQAIEEWRSQGYPEEWLITYLSEGATTDEVAEVSGRLFAQILSIRESANFADDAEVLRLAAMAAICQNFATIAPIVRAVEDMVAWLPSRQGKIDNHLAMAVRQDLEHIRHRISTIRARLTAALAYQQAARHAASATGFHSSTKVEGFMRRSQNLARLDVPAWAKKTEQRLRKMSSLLSSG